MTVAHAGALSGCGKDTAGPEQPSGSLVSQVKRVEAAGQAEPTEEAEQQAEAQAATAALVERIGVAPGAIADTAPMAPQALLMSRMGTVELRRVGEGEFMPVAAAEEIELLRARG